MAGKIAHLLGVPIDNDKYSVMGLCVVLPVAYLEAEDKVH
jgi:hypothetical protein